MEPKLVTSLPTLESFAAKTFTRHLYREARMEIEGACAMNMELATIDDPRNSDRVTKFRLVHSDPIGNNKNVNNSSDNDMPVKLYAIRPLQNSKDYSSLAPYARSNTPSTNYYGVPPYGSTPFEGASIIILQFPFLLAFPIGHDPLADGVVDLMPLSNQPVMGMLIGFRAMEKWTRKLENHGKQRTKAKGHAHAPVPHA
ncbi:hypothetical protein PIB30_070241 [Stylosanthes scabra]|uniref:Uncharacterized protein n=1 Tax=Stylosanthes scabra TaxID=79078 RepID=A0ABU6RNZ2_9FABA|nr:hypothetical protein [Stylosanthes scabra]